ncbi:hypothetical protein TNCV_134701 [Trichonephila clavipes]|nr:hypothetical protein TNCV_134701 [Trichonephila clavipes]
MDPHMHNLAQPATALELELLNIPVNTFRNLTDFFPARLAAARSAKGSLTRERRVLEHLIRADAKINDDDDDDKRAHAL